MIHSTRHGYSWTQQILRQFYQWLATTLEGKKQRSTIASLDGVRALACLCVITLHISLVTSQDIHLWSRETFPPLVTAVAFAGDTGVTLFFVLSGFLLFLPYARALLFEDASWPSTRRFYLRRVLRILPAYYVSLCLMVLLFRPEYLHLDHLKQWFFFLTLFMDSSASTYKSINGPFWTLAVEWQFYLILPWLALLISRIVQRGTLPWRAKKLMLCLGAVIIWGILSRYAGIYLSDHPAATFLLPRALVNDILPFIYGAQTPGLHGKFLEDFAIGMLVSTCYVLMRALPPEHLYHNRLQRLAPWLLMGSLVWLLCMAMWKFNQGMPHTWPLFDAMGGVYSYLSEFFFALGYGALVAAVLFSPAWLKRPFEWAPLRWFGIISYGIYMWHLLLLESATDHIVVHLQGWPPLLLYGFYWSWLLLFVVPCAFLLFLLVEKPWMEKASRSRT